MCHFIMMSEPYQNTGISCLHKISESVDLNKRTRWDIVRKLIKMWVQINMQDNTFLINVYEKMSDTVTLHVHLYVCISFFTEKNSTFVYHLSLRGSG